MYIDRATHWAFAGTTTMLEAVMVDFLCVHCCFCRVGLATYSSHALYDDIHGREMDEKKHRIAAYTDIITISC